MRCRLEELKLVPKREAKSELEAITVDQLVCLYFKDQRIKERTAVRYGNQLTPLKAFFGQVDDIHKLTVGDGKRFLNHLHTIKKPDGSHYAQNTIHKMLKTPRQVFTYAVDNKMMEENILAGVKVGETIDEDRVVEISEELASQMIDQANTEYKMVIALARWGGLRCPSELSELKWADFDWGNGKFLVRSPKTEHQGKAQRLVPIFPS